jgi:hypothetical protein
MAVAAIVAGFATVFPALKPRMAFTMPARMLMRITLMHPTFLHKINRLAAGVVVVAVTAPILLVRSRDVKVDRLALHHYSRLHKDRVVMNRRRNNNGLWIHHCRLGVIANVNAAIDARLVNANRHTHIGLRLHSVARHHDGGGCRHQRESSQFCHTLLSGVGVFVQRPTPAGC